MYRMQWKHWRALLRRSDKIIKNRNGRKPAETAEAAVIGLRGISVCAEWRHETIRVYETGEYYPGIILIYI